MKEIYNGSAPLNIDQIYEKNLIFFSYGTTIFIHNFIEGYHTSNWIRDSDIKFYVTQRDGVFIAMLCLWRGDGNSSIRLDSSNV